MFVVVISLPGMGMIQDLLSEHLEVSRVEDQAPKGNGTRGWEVPVRSEHLCGCFSRHEYYPSFDIYMSFCR